MTLQAMMQQVESWTVEDRLQLIERIWAGILNEGQEPNLTDAQKVLLDERIDDDDNAPDDVVSWDVVRSEALRRIGR